jgi:hypothetical protein
MAEETHRHGSEVTPRDRFLCNQKGEGEGMLAMTLNWPEHGSKWRSPVSSASVAIQAEQGEKEPLVSHPVSRPKLNTFLYVCQDQVSHIKRQIVK